MAGQDLTLYTGDSKSLLVTVTDGNGNPVNITNAQVISWALIQNDQITLQKTLQAGQITITSGSAGQFTINLQAADTASLLPGVYTQECRVTTSTQSGIVFTGSVTVTKAHI